MAYHTEPSILGVPSGRYEVYDYAGDRLLGRWDTHDDATAHQGEAQAMDPEAEIHVIDSEEDEQTCDVDFSVDRGFSDDAPF